MREYVLKRLAKGHVKHPWMVLVIMLLITVLMAGLSTRLTLSPRWSDLLPEDDPRTVHFNQIIDEFTSATSLILVLQGNEERIKAFADRVAPKIKAAVDTTRNQPLVKRVDYKADMDFIRDHGLMLIKSDDLETTRQLYTDANLTGLLTNLNNSLEEEYVGREESISTREKEDRAVVMLDGIQAFVSFVQQIADGEAIDDSVAQAAMDRLLLGEPYFLSYDQQALILNIIPNFTMMDTDLLVSGTDEIQRIVDRELERFDGVQAGLTGMIAVGRDEMVYSQQSLGYTSLIAFAAILVLLILSFRMWIAPMLAGINLIVGIIWASGVAALAVGQLNIMTSMFAVILIGLGIDFSIHLITGFTEYHEGGASIQDAMSQTFMKLGKGILTGGVTTSVAFLAMTISHSRGMKEMGLVSGLGLLSILAVTFLFLPALLVLRARFQQRREHHRSDSRQQRDLSFGFLGRLATLLGRRYIVTLTCALLISAFLVISAFGIKFDHNYMNIEPKGLVSIALQDTIMEKFDLGMDYGMVVADSPEQSHTLAETYRDASTVAMVEDISVYLPTPEQQDRRRPHLLQVQSALEDSKLRSTLSRSEMSTFITQLQRLEMNIIEIQDMAFLGGHDKVDRKAQDLVGSPEDSTVGKRRIAHLVNTCQADRDASRQSLTDYQKRVAPYVHDTLMRMANTEPMQLSDLPESILDQYSNEERTHFLVTVFPSGNIWQNARFLDRFTHDIESISSRTTGMPSVFNALIDIIGRDGRNAAFLTVLVMFGLLWFDFGKPGYALIAMIPLAVGCFWMVGLMHLLGEKLNVMNVMGIPLIIGIGIDDGVHIMHRWLGEGKERIKLVFASTGKAILLTSLTTMLGFGSLIFSVWRGFAQLGSALFIGVAACFLTTVVFLSPILTVLGKRHR